MRKTISLIIFTAMVLTSSLTGCDINVSDAHTTELSDKVISVIDKSTPITQGNLITKTKTDDNGSISVDYYNSNGNMVESYVWDKNDNMTSHSVMTYDANNNITLKEHIDANGNRPFTENFYYTHDGKLDSKAEREYSDGKLTKETNFDSNGKKTGHSLTHYKDTLLVKVERFEADGELDQYYVYEYNDNKQTIKYSSYNGDGELEKYTTFEYKNNVLAKEMYFDDDDELIKYYLFEYFESGNKKSVNCYDKDNKLISSDYFDDISN